MQEENLSILGSLKQNIEEIVTPLDVEQSEVYGDDTEKMQSGLDLIMGELTMIVLLLTGTDSDVADREVKFLNDMRHVVYGYGIPELNLGDFLELCQEFLRVHPERSMTLDHLPSSIRLLLAYDQAHGTEFADKARMLFVQFAEALVKADNNEHPVEAIILANFKDILNAT